MPKQPIKVFSPVFKGLKSHDLNLYLLKTALYCIGIIFIILFESYFYYFRNISFNELIPDFIIGLAIVIILIEIAFFGVQKIIDVIKLEIAEKQRLEETTRYRVEFNRLVTSISTKFINLVSDEIDQGITQALKEVGELAEVDRCHVFLINVKEATINNTHEWCAPGIESQIDHRTKLPIAQFQWWIQKLNNFEDIHIPRVSDLPATAQSEKEVLEAFNIQSTIVVPIVYKNNLMGYLGFDSVRKERIWPNEIIVLLRIVGEIIANALKRKEAELMFEKFVEYAPIGIYYSDFKGTINYANKKTEDIIGYKQEDVVGTNIFDLNIIDPRWRYKALKLLASNKQGGTTGPDEFLLNHKDGSHITVALNTRVITFNENQVILGMVSDITEQKQLENHLRQAQKMEAITMLSGGIAHDFNNILGSIFGAVDLLQLQLAEDHPSRRYANIILDRSQKAAVLVKQMLAYSRQQHLNLKSLNINKTIEEVSVLLDRELKVNIQFKKNLAQDLKNIDGDKTAIHQIIMNLCDNAIDAMPDGGILSIETKNKLIDESDIEVKPELKYGEYVSVKISDTGIGIAPDNMIRIFEPFYTTREVGKGHGLGLSMAFGLVKQHDGYIYCTSKVHEETIFEVLLPIIETNSINEKKQFIGSDLYTSIGTILIVEDEIDLIQILEEMLTTLEYNVLCAHDGKSALKVYHENRDNIDLIISDIVMPKMDGKELYQKVKAIDSDIKFIFISGYASRGFYNITEKVPGAEVLNKPFRLNEVAETIKLVLSSN